MSALALLLLLLGGGENRLWLVEIELAGACDEVRLDCGADGTTIVRGPFAAGEDRRLVVPVPVRAPLGAASLVEAALPRATVVPSGATVTVRGFAAEQPATFLERSAGALLARPRPPIAREPARAGRGELLLVLVAGVLLLRLRARLAAAAPIALVAGVAALFLARGRVGANGDVRLRDWEWGSDVALLVHAAEGELPLVAGRLEVEPAGSSLELACAPDGRDGVARAPGGRVTSLATVAAPALDPGANPGEPLEAVWTRAASGGWLAHGAWPRGAALGPATAAASPPGWLASGLPQGRAVLLARTASGEWYRCFGFERP